MQESVLKQAERNSFVEVLLPKVFFKTIGHIRNNVILFHEFVYVRFDFVVSFLCVEEFLGNCELVWDKSETDVGTDIRSPLDIWLELANQIAEHPAKDHCCAIKPIFNWLGLDKFMYILVKQCVFKLRKHLQELILYYFDS